MIYKTNYNLGDFVYIRTDKEQKQSLITQIRIMPTNGNNYMAMYFIVCNTGGDWFYELEFSIEKDLSKTF